MALRENYQDDILNTSINVSRRFQIINNDDGTVSFIDVTDYSQVGDSFGAGDINATNKAINALGENLGNLKFTYIETTISEFVDKSTLECNYRVGTAWNNALIFVQMTSKYDYEKTAKIVAAPLVANGYVKISALSDGLFENGDSVSVNVLLLLDTSVVG